MGWPKKDEKYRLYLEKKSKTYLLVVIEVDSDKRGTYDALGEILTNPGDSINLASCTVSRAYLNTWANAKVKRVSWNELPARWQATFKKRWFDAEPKERIEDARGLWRVGEKRSC